MLKRSVTNFLHALAAVLVGNAAYFLLLPFLPLAARHVPFQVDLGIAVDGCFCLVSYAVIKGASGRASRSKLGKR